MKESYKKRLVTKEKTELFTQITKDKILHRMIADISGADNTKMIVLVAYVFNLGLTEGFNKGHEIGFSKGKKAIIDYLKAAGHTDP